MGGEPHPHIWPPNSQLRVVAAVWPSLASPAQSLLLLSLSSSWLTQCLVVFQLRAHFESFLPPLRSASLSPVLPMKMLRLRPETLIQGLMARVQIFLAPSVMI